MLLHHDAFRAMEALTHVRIQIPPRWPGHYEHDTKYSCHQSSLTASKSAADKHCSAEKAP